jgi:hypothetical protein
MKLESTVKAPWNKGEFAILTSKAEKHLLELNWYVDVSPVAGLFREGDKLYHFGFQVDHFYEALDRLKKAGYRGVLRLHHTKGWSFGMPRNKSKDRFRKRT